MVELHALVLGSPGVPTKRRRLEKSCAVGMIQETGRVPTQHITNGRNRRIEGGSRRGWSMDSEAIQYGTQTVTIPPRVLVVWELVGGQRGM